MFLGFRHPTPVAYARQYQAEGVFQHAAASVFRKPLTRQSGRVMHLSPTPKFLAWLQFCQGSRVLAGRSSSSRGRRRTMYGRHRVSRSPREARKLLLRTSCGRSPRKAWTSRTAVQPVRALCHKASKGLRTPLPPGSRCGCRSWSEAAEPICRLPWSRGV